MKISFYQGFLAILFSAFFVFFSSYSLSIEKGWVILIPIIFYVFFSLFNIDNLLWFIILLTPLSIPITELGFIFENINFTFPTEFLLFGLLFVLIIQMIFYYQRFVGVFNHKITYFLCLYLLWMFLSCFTSTDPLISFKLFLTRLWYIIPFYFFMILLFRERENIFKFILLYTIPLCCVVIYTLIQQSGDFFDSKIANGAVHPFFNDHTSYGAILAFFVPSVFIIMCSEKYFRKWNIVLFMIIIILSIGLVFSYTRAAWISFIIASCFGLFLKMKLNLKHIISLSFIFLGFFFMYQDTLISNEESSDSFFRHFQSTSNITTDASNMERINRWNCAIKMFNEKPIIGYGPGTYQFEYAAFQDSGDKTIISTKFGDGGNAHSEYLSALSETGIIGLCIFLLLVGSVFLKGIKLYYTLSCEESKMFILCSLIALMTYFIHAFFNNFLDIDKVSIAVWSFIAIIVSIDLSYKENRIKN